MKSAAIVGSLFTPDCPPGQIHVPVTLQSQEKCRLRFYDVAAGEANSDTHELTDRIDAHDGAFHVCSALSRLASCDQTAALSVRHPLAVSSD